MYAIKWVHGFVVHYFVLSLGHDCPSDSEAALWNVGESIAIMKRIENITTAKQSTEKRMHISWYLLDNRSYDDIIIWKFFLHYLYLVKGIHRSPMASPHNDPVVRSLAVSFVIDLNQLLHTVQLLVVSDAMMFVWCHSLYCYFDGIVINGSCQNDNFQCSQW